MLRKIAHYYAELSSHQLILVSTLLSLALVSRVLYIQHGWINNDFVLYHEMARLFSLGEWSNGMEIFNWPLYPLLIAAIHHVADVDISTAARLLTGFMFIAMTYSFLTLVTLCHDTKASVISGAFILFGADYIVGDVLPMLLRDTGFWAFLLTSLVFFIRFYQKRNLSDGILWQLCALIATLFRLEGVTFLIGLPIFIFFYNLNIRKKRYYFFSSYLITGILTLSIGYVLWASDDLSLSSIGRLEEVASPKLLSDLTQNFTLRAKVMSEHVLGHFLKEYATAGLILTFVYILFVKVLTATGLIQTGLAYFSIKRKSFLINSEAFNILMMTAFISVINGFLIITKVFVLSSRYMMPTVLILMIFASVFLGDWIQNNFKIRQKKANQFLLFAVMIFLSLSLVKNILPKPEGYNYQQNAVRWLKQTNKDNLPVFYDSTRVRHFANEPFISNWGNEWAYLNKAIENNSINQFHYLMINIPNSHPEYVTTIKSKLSNFKEIKRFHALSNKYIAIYEKNN